MDMPNKQLLQLPTVTLFGIDAHDPKGLTRAADICLSMASFGAVNIITAHNYFRGREGYSKYCIEKMDAEVQTEHVLIIHPDGYIQNPNEWDNSWLQYDYIGATWDWYNKNMVGNGGFSLRSKKLLSVLSQIDTSMLNLHPEDDFICRKIRYWLEDEHDIKFAPVEVAKRFSIEGYGLKPNYNVYRGEFGFHGRYVSGLPIPLTTK